MATINFFQQSQSPFQGLCSQFAELTRMDQVEPDDSQNSQHYPIEKHFYHRIGATVLHVDEM